MICHHKQDRLKFQKTFWCNLETICLENDSNFGNSLKECLKFIWYLLWSMALIIFHWLHDQKLYYFPGLRKNTAKQLKLEIIIYKLSLVFLVRKPSLFILHGSLFIYLRKSVLLILNCRTLCSECECLCWFMRNLEIIFRNKKYNHHI